MESQIQEAVTITPKDVDKLSQALDIATRYSREQTQLDFLVYSREQSSDCAERKDLTRQIRNARRRMKRLSYQVEMDPLAKKLLPQAKSHDAQRLMRVQEILEGTFLGLVYCAVTSERESSNGEGKLFPTLHVNSGPNRKWKDFLRAIMAGDLPDVLARLQGLLHDMVMNMACTRLSPLSGPIEISPSDVVSGEKYSVN